MITKTSMDLYEDQPTRPGEGSRAPDAHLTIIDNGLLYVQVILERPGSVATSHFIARADLQRLSILLSKERAQ